MARIMLSAMPFTGHVNPVLALADALVARGHEVRVYTGRAFADAVAGAGAQHVPWRVAPDFDENNLEVTFPRLVGKKGLGQLLINVQDVFIKTVPAQVADLQAEWEREPWDVIVGDELSIGAVLWAEKHGCRRATLAVLPLNMPGPYGPPSGMGIAPGTNVVTRARDGVLRAAVPLLSGPLKKPLAQARAEVGLPPSSLIFGSVVFSAALVLASGCPLLDYENPSRPGSLRYIGELARRAPADFAPPTWWGDLDGRAVVYVSQGTQNIDPTDLLRPTLEALADEDVLVIATTGVRDRDELPFAVPANARVAGFIPHAHLLPRVEVVVTNGGWGGTLGALARGIPLVIGGGDLDKPEVAARVAWAGAGVNLKTGTPSARAVREAVRLVRSEPQFRAAARRVGEQLSSLGGADAAASALEDLLTA